MAHITTLTEFILQEERRYKTATGNFTLLLTQIAAASKVIAAQIRKAGLVDIVGAAGSTNAYEDEVQKLDIFSNETLVNTLIESQQVHAVMSEELDEPVYVEKYGGQYTVFLDPLDGSSVIDSNTPIGTIFSIYHKSSNLLQPGNKQVGAGYIIYGPSVMFIYTAGNGVNGFTLDPAIGSFILSHPNMRIPEYKDIYSINEGNSELYFDNLKAYLHTIKTKEKPFKLRYVGSMIGDVHRTLIKGGIYLYPEDKKSADGKLRLMLEVNPMSMVIQQAGGMAVSKTIDPLSIKPNSLTQRAPIILGSKKNVEEYLSFVK